MRSAGDLTQSASRRTHWATAHGAVVRRTSGATNGDAGIAEGTPTGPGTNFRLLGVPMRVSTQGQAGGKVILLYDPDPDQLASVACSQQWQATSLRGR
jgi:hypothetical protein